MRMRQELAGTPQATVPIAGCHTFFVSAATLSLTSHADVQLPKNKFAVVLFTRDNGDRIITHVVLQALVQQVQDARSGSDS